MVELVADRLVIATPGERHIDEVFRIRGVPDNEHSLSCRADRVQENG